MDSKVLFWTGALLHMAAVVGLALAGVARRRRGDLRNHVRLMIAAASLVALFLVAYAFKLFLLGREDTNLWSTRDLWVLRIHESCVATMLVAGAMAGRRAAQLRRTRDVTANAADPPAAPSLTRSHRRAGWAAVVAAALGLGTALCVLLAMYARAGLL
jgi:uncharacterized membrane protein YozB (DUF420 family)